MSESENWSPICSQFECMNPATGTRLRTDGALVDNGVHNSYEPVCDEHNTAR